MPRRTYVVSLAVFLSSMLVASPALASDGGEGLYGKANDKVITNFGFGLMIFFTVLVVSFSLVQRALEKRKRPK